MSNRLPALDLSLLQFCAACSVVGHQKRGSRENLFGSKHRLQSCRVEQRSSGPTTEDPVDNWNAAVRVVYRIALYL
jgi:hypothetical protein